MLQQIYINNFITKNKTKKYLLKISQAMTSIRRQFVQKDTQAFRNNDQFRKHACSSTSTDASQLSPRNQRCSKDLFDDSFRQPYKGRQNKEKSQLCKKFVQNGYCPYEKKCKFAHGSHELRKNLQTNSKYKTKICDVFVNEGFCVYGQRCNFIHKHSDKIDLASSFDTVESISQICKNPSFDTEFQLIKAGIRSQSRLLSLLAFE